MSRYRTRRPRNQITKALRPLVELRTSPAYFEGGNAMAEEAHQAAFAAEVAIQAISGSKRMPRRFREELYAATRDMVSGLVENVAILEQENSIQQPLPVDHMGLTE